MNRLWEKALLASPFSQREVETQLNRRNKPVEGYECYVEKNKAYINADRQRDLTCALMQYTRFYKAKSQSLSLGRVEPRYPFRPLWVTGDESFYVSDNFKVSLPSSWLKNPEEATFSAAYQLLDCGFNALILGNLWSYVEGSQSLEQVAGILSQFRKFGLKLYAALRLEGEKGHPFSSLMQSFPKQMDAFLTQFPALDGILLYSNLKLKFDEHLLFHERLLEEVHLAKESVGDKELIYYLNLEDRFTTKACARWFEEILDAIPNGVTVAFSRAVGDVRNQSFHENTILRSLEMSLDASSTPLMPVMNMGGVSWGEGLWPAPPLRELESTLHMMQSLHPFAGVIPLTSYLPAEDGFLKGTLWVAGQTQWHSECPMRLMEMWLYGSMQVKKSSDIRGLLQDAENVVALLQKSKSSANHEQEYKERVLGHIVSYAELMKYKLRQLGRKERGSLYHMFEFFLRDVKKLSLLWSQEWKIKLQGVAEGDDMKDSLWVHVETHGSRGLGGSVRGALLKEPHTSPNNPKLEKLILENR